MRALLRRPARHGSHCADVAMVGRRRREERRRRLRSDRRRQDPLTVSLLVRDVLFLRYCPAGLYRAGSVVFWYLERWNICDPLVAHTSHPNCAERSVLDVGLLPFLISHLSVDRMWTVPDCSLWSSTNAKASEPDCHTLKFWPKMFAVAIL